MAAAAAFMIFFSSFFLNLSRFCTVFRSRSSHVLRRSLMGRFPTYLPAKAGGRGDSCGCVSVTACVCETEGNYRSFPAAREQHLWRQEMTRNRSPWTCGTTCPSPPCSSRRTCTCVSHYMHRTTAKGRHIDYDAKLEGANTTNTTPQVSCITHHELTVIHTPSANETRRNTHVTVLPP